MSPRSTYPPQSSRPSRSPDASPDDRRAQTSLRESYVAVPESLRMVRDDLVGFAEGVGATDQTVEAIRLASSEAAANVVEHAYTEATGTIEVSAKFDRDSISVVVADQGSGLKLATKSPPALGRGVGVLWMAWFSDSMTHLASPAGGLEVRMRFALN